MQHSRFRVAVQLRLRHVSRILRAVSLMPTSSILIIGESKSYQRLRAELRECGYRLVHAKTPAAAHWLLSTIKASLVVICDRGAHDGETFSDVTTAESADQSAQSFDHAGSTGPDPADDLFDDPYGM